MRVKQVACALTFASGCLLPGSASAQDVSSTVDSIDFRSDARSPQPNGRLIRSGEDGGPIEIALIVQKTPKFTLSLDVPAMFADNPEHSPIGSADAAHITPTGKFSFSDKSGQWSYGFAVSAISDDFIGGAAKDTSILAGAIFVTLRNRTQKLAVTSSYSPKRVFSGTFGTGTVTLHDLSIGLGRTFPVGGVSVAIDLSYVRREASKAGFQQHQPSLLTVFSGQFGGGFSWQLKQQVQRRIFSDPTSLDRRDWNFSTLAEVSRPLGKFAVAKLDLIFERNDSNLALKRYSAFDVGPKLSIAYKF